MLVYGMDIIIFVSCKDKIFVEKFSCSSVNPVAEKAISCGKDTERHFSVLKSATDV